MILITASHQACPFSLGGLHGLPEPLPWLPFKIKQITSSECGLKGLLEVLGASGSGGGGDRPMTPEMSHFHQQKEEHSPLLLCRDLLTFPNYHQCLCKESPADELEESGGGGW